MRDEHGLSHKELIAATDMSQAYYFNRMAGHKAFGLTDIERLAGAFETHWFALFRLAADLAEQADHALGSEGSELSNRINDLITAGLREDGSSFAWESFADAASEAGLRVGPEELADLLARPGSIQSDRRILEVMTAYWEIPPPYLSDLENLEAVEMTSAIMDFRRAMKDTGARPMASRVLGEISPTALRAVARTIRSAHSGTGEH